MTFLHPHLLWLLLLLPVLLLIYVLWRRKQQASLRMPSLHFLDGVGGGVRVYLRHSVFALRLLALGLIIIALARPQSSSSWSEDRVEGIDIMLTMDISTSMLAMDFQPNRVEAAKEVAMRFVANRPNDNIGLRWRKLHSLPPDTGSCDAHQPSSLDDSWDHRGPDGHWLGDRYGYRAPQGK